MKKLLVASLISVAATSSAMAEGIVPLMDLGFAMEYNVPAASGYLNYDGDDYATKTDFNSDPDKQMVLSAYLEHPIPVIPNIAIKYTPVKLSLRTTVTVKSGDTNLHTGTATNDIKLDQLDTTLYYKFGIPFSDLIKLKAGMTVKTLMTDIKTTQESGASETQKADIPVPMGHLGLSLNPPLLGLGFHADINYISYGENSLSDYTLKADYKIPMVPGLKAEAGYRAMQLKLDDRSDISSDVKISGMFAGVAYVF